MVFKRTKLNFNIDVFQINNLSYRLIMEDGEEQGIFLRSPIVTAYQVKVGIANPVYFKRLYTKYVCIGKDGYIRKISSKGILLYPKIINSSIFEKTIFKYADGHKLRLINRDEWYYTIRKNIEEALLEEDK